ncbi:alpha/beta fold hydrolase [Aerosakkonemataceae cyanobacterium BLCC-F50]|uniref:Alpha/beta fold hydrolase n=1 Tax=Floridaenema flaviceps BLCC-F50 TaxID=3153642 RepID=A0ABV4XX63_9CYAN
MNTTSPATSPTNTDRLLQKYAWNWQGQQLWIVYETAGKGTPVLLLPAFSTVSSRSEMAGLANLLAPYFQTVTLDWPGFGESDRPPLDYKPTIFQQFLADFVKTVFKRPVAVVAAGHSAGYVMQLANQQPELFSHIVLTAPTWRGPLPTMAGKQEDWFSIIRETVRSPILGDILYSLNTAPPFLSYMYQSHVFTDTKILSSDFIDRKWQITQKPGGKFAPVAFVTGALDPVQTNSEFLSLFNSISLPIMVVIGEQCPPKSKQEMDNLAQLSNIQTRYLPGSLGMHEEFPQQIASEILPFLQS